MTWRELINDIIENHHDMLDTEAIIYIDERNHILLNEVTPIAGVLERFDDPDDRKRDDNDLVAFISD
jgi:hypothetical protein